MIIFIMLIFDIWFYLMLVLVLFTGMSIGSFMNVVIYRLPLMIYQQQPGLSLTWPPSHCPGCQQSIRWYHNIPLLSWLMLRGRCGYCSIAISPVYPISELICGIYFVVEFVFHLHAVPYSLPGLQILYQILPALVLFCLLYCVVCIDIQHYLIPDLLSYGLLWSGLVFSALHLIGVTPVMAILGCVVAWSVMALLQWGYRCLRRQNGLGSGDVKLFAAAMPWLGLEKLPLLVAFSALLGLIFFAGIYGWRKIRPAQNGCRFGLLCHTDHEQGQEYYEDIDQNQHLPFGPAIAVATLLMFFGVGTELIR